MYDRELVAALDAVPISPEEKGFGGPLHRASITPAELVAASAHAGDGWLGSPRLLVQQSALRHNIEAMADFCAARDIALYPHGKTTMSPQLVALQLDAGAAGVTVANTTQARLFRRYGVTDVLIANEVTDEAAITWLGRELADDPAATLTCYVDSVAGVQRLTATLLRTGATRPLDVLVELGHDGGRTGARSQSEALSVADAVAGSTQLSLVGVAGYEGSIHAPSVEENVRATTEYCERLGTLAGDLLSSGRLEGVPIVTAGGSAWFDVVVDVLGGEPAWQLVLRSGCYLSHDHGMYASVSPSGRDPQMPRLRPSLEVWAPVLSRPDQVTAVVGVGRRDVSSDAGPPVPLRAQRGSTPVDVIDAQVVRMFDQHLVLTVPADCTLTPGDEVVLGISHPCTTFDKWRWLPLVDDDQGIVAVLRTFF